MKTDNVGSISPLATKPQLPIKKQSILTRWTRFLGFSSVKAVEVTKYIPSNKAASQLSARKEHTVVKLAEDFQGFRCNKKNFATLEAELLKAPELQKGRSPENRQAKVRLAMVAAGMATMTNSNPVEVVPVHRYLVAPEFQAEKFEQLHLWLNSSDADLLKSFGPKGAEIATTWPLPDTSPSNLGMIAGVDNIDDDVDKVIRFRQCRDYFLHGEGAELIKDSPTVPHLAALLPDISEACLVPGVSSHVNVARKKTGSTAGTNTEMFKRYNADSGIEVRTPTIAQTYDPDSRDMRSLAIIEELKHLYAGLCTAAKTLHGADDADMDAYGKYNKLGLSSQFVLNGISQTIARNAWPTMFSDELYQQLIMPSSDDANVTRWNSDNSAPRGEWLHERDFSEYLPPDNPVT